MSQPTKAVTKDGGRCVFSLQAEFFLARLALHSFQKYSLLNILTLKKKKKKPKTPKPQQLSELDTGLQQAELDPL